MHDRERLVLAVCLWLSSCKADVPPATAGTDSTGGSGVEGSSASAGSGSSSVGADTTEGTEGCGTSSAAALVRCVDGEAITRDVSFLADIRTPGSVHWLAVQELCIDRLTMLGFEVELHEYESGTNVIGRLPGTEASDELVLVGAHYDHIPDCLGADDNATGVAGALEVARVLATADVRPRALAIACWDEEELGLVGSTAWVEGAQVPGETVVAYFNFDMIGYASHEAGSQEIPFGFDAVFPEQYQEVADNDFRGDFILMVADELATAPAEAFVVHAAAVGLTPIYAVLDGLAKNSDLFADLRRSDHAPFWQADIPAMFLTDTANFRNVGYHCLGGEDTVDSLDFEFEAKVVAATVGAAAETLGVAP